MRLDRFEIEVAAGRSRRLAIGWLFLALGALVLGGVLSILIVLSRTPGVQNIIPWTDFFHTAIIVHVDLTVLVWFLAFAGVFWSQNSSERAIGAGWLGFGLCALGTVVFTAAPFFGAGEPLMNNYIPILLDPVFLIGLGLVGIGFALMVVRSLISLPDAGDWRSGAGAMRFGVTTALVAAFAALLSVIASYCSMPPVDQARAQYELLFWGGGHVLQTTHTQLMVVSWLGLATAAGLSPKLSPGAVWVIVALGFAPVLGVPWLYWRDAVGSASHLIGFTRFMEYGGGIAALPIGLMIVLAAAKSRATPFSAEASALLMSIALFATGGVIGYLIRGANVTIPAHYHGSIVGVTIAFMGIVYFLLPRLGFDKPMTRLARWQPVIYGTGQFLHVSGLAWAGGYGIQRKTAGVAQGLHSLREVAAMTMMGIGGVTSVLGGFLFLLVAIGAIWGGLRRKA